MNCGYILPNAEYYILIGRKIHTMRGDPKNRWRTGIKIHHHIGRFKKYRCFAIHEVVSVQRVRITLRVNTSSRLYVRIDGKRVNDQVIRALACNDGFDNLQDFIRWFFPPHKRQQVKDRTWTGNLIHWTSLKYIGNGNSSIRADKKNTCKA
jgi:hypothetical protein